MVNVCGWTSVRERIGRRMRSSYKLRVVVTLAAAVGTLDCGGSHEEPEVSDLQGTEWQAILQARIGSINDPDQSLTQVDQVLFGPNGTMYIAQRKDANVRVYSADGELLATIGRSGDGPGEFRSIDRLGFLEDTLYVTDSSLGRISYFGDSRFLKSVFWVTQMFPAPDGMYLSTVPQVLLPDGSGLAAIYHTTIRTSEPKGVLTTEYETPYFHVWRESQQIDTVAWGGNHFKSTGVTSAGTTFRFACPDFTRGPLHNLMINGTGVVVVEQVNDDQAPTAFRVRLIGPRGDTVFDEAVPYAPVAVSEPAVQRAVKQIRDASRHSVHTVDVPAAPEIERAMRAADCIPANLPPVSQVVTTQDGSIWLRREDLATDSILWNILGQGGRIQGRLWLPSSQTVAAMADDILAVTERDELDVPFVVRYRLRRR